MRVIIDAMGGDNAPAAIVKGAVRARKELGVDISLVGRIEDIKACLANEGANEADFEIIDAREVITMEDDPSTATRRKKDASMTVALNMVRDGQGDFLMKGLCSTDKFLRAVLNKETGLLPPKGTLTHCGVLEIPQYHKLLFVGDVAVIPAPDFKQKQVIMDCLVKTAKALGVEKPKVAVIAATEQVLPSQPATIEAAMLAKMADRGQIKGCVVDGPLALDVAIDQESVEIKGLVSPVAGDADCLLFPNIESGNVFYKVNSKLVPGVRQAGILVGAKVPCVLSSRADSIDTKLNSIAVAAMSAR